MKCLMARGLMCGWTGVHNPTYSAATLDANTSPTAALTAVTCTSSCNGYVVGYGAAYTNRGSGLVDYGQNSPLLTSLKLMLSVASDFSLGLKYLVLSDKNLSQLTNNADSYPAYGQMLDYINGMGIPTLRCCMSELEAKGYGYSEDYTYYKQFRGIIVLLDRLDTDTYKPTDAFLKTLATAFKAGCPFIVMQKDGYSGIDTFNRLFADLHMSFNASTWVQFHSSAVQEYVSRFGTDTAWQGISSLSNSPLFLAGCASYNINVAQGSQIAGLQGTWYVLGCVDEVKVDDPDVWPGVVQSNKCCLPANSWYSADFDISMDILKPDDWRTGLESKALVPNFWGDWQDQEKSKNYLYIESRGLKHPGFNTPAYQANIINYRGVWYSGTRSYNVLVIDRATGNAVDYRQFDVFGSTAQAQALAAYLNSLDASKIVVVAAHDEPMANVKNSPYGVADALMRIGGSHNVLNYRMKYRGAYILVGIPDLGDGRGLERYVGAVDDDPASVTSLRVDLKRNACPKIIPIMSDNNGRVYMAEFIGHNDRVIVDANYVHFRTAVLDWNAGEIIRRAVNKVKLNGNNRILVACDISELLTTPSASGHFAFESVLKNAGYAVDIWGIPDRPVAKPKDFTPYGAVVLALASEGNNRKIEPFVDSLMSAVRRGVGLFFAGDWHPKTSNLLLRYYSLVTTLLSTTDSSGFDLQANAGKHTGSDLIRGLNGHLVNDLINNCCIEQNLGLVPVAIDTETLQMLGVKNSGRTLSFRYSRMLEAYDNLKQFYYNGYASLTDMRFKKLDMKGTDDFTFTIGLPCVPQLDQPDIAITDCTVTEGNEALIFGSHISSFVESMWFVTGDGTSRTDVMLNRSKISDVSNWNSMLRNYGVRMTLTSDPNGDSNYENWYAHVIYKIYVPKSDTYLWRLSSDNYMSWSLDGTPIFTNNSDDNLYKNYKQDSIYLSQGHHVIEVINRNDGDGGGWGGNPYAFCLLIHKDFAIPLEQMTGGVDAQVTITLSEALRSYEPLTVTYTTQDGSAVANSDYKPISGSVDFQCGEQTKTLTVPIVRDSIHEDLEKFNVVLTSASRGQIVDSLGEITITDDDAAAPVSSGALVARWWVPYAEFSSGWGGQGKRLFTENPAWHQGQRIVLYFMRFARLASVDPNAYACVGYKRVVCVWGDNSTQTFYECLEKSYKSYAYPGSALTNAPYYALGTSQFSAGGLVLVDNGMYINVDDTYTNNLYGMSGDADAVYIYAYAVPDSDDYAPLPRYACQNNVGVQADAQLYGLIDYPVIEYQDFIESNGYQGSVYPDLSGLQTATVQAAKDTLFRVINNAHGTDYVRVPTLVPPEDYPEVKFISSWSAYNRMGLSSADYKTAQLCAVVVNYYCEVSRYSLSDYKSNISKLTQWGCAPYPGLSWGPLNMEEQSDLCYIWSRDSFANLGKDRY